ncbi:hypothetical protein FK004_01320 [Flavobacterium kingsejongi]|uniref:L,D-transpeptidase catalytic domain protein n=2 Tax=Flavobacterium kingsejongi TaxID=1678728 RepID=A0A2S1LTY5_9FLAO|nr:hypothetical protein FK004_01320 [Flavobacterium kingsejongi]
MIYRFMPLVVFFLLSFSTNAPKTNNVKEIVKTSTTNNAMVVENVYNSLHTQNFALPRLESFKKALEGFYLLKAKGVVTKDILTLVDFSLSSNKKRMWVIDLATNTILYQSLVSHGRNSGDEFAEKFSNVPESYQSSLGFYATGNTYTGKHGMSLQLEGLEKGINDRAKSRAIVIHGADYADESFIKAHGRLGRSQGCPAIPMSMRDDIIKAIKGKSCLFIYHPSKSYEASTKLVSNESHSMV